MSYKWDNRKPTAQMLGRWQPFHDGHYALFKEIVKITGQVCIQICLLYTSPSPRD